MEALLRVEHLKKQFHRNSDGTYVLKDISFEMMPGECLGLIGNSGSGKSTIVKILTGITTATKGCIYLEGKQISGKRTQKEIGKKVQMIFQNPKSSLNPKMTIGQNLDDALLYYRKIPKTERKRQCEEILERVHLPVSYLAKYPSQISGGECQRVCIARALLRHPALLICDEATSALDPTTTRSILALLKEINQKYGITIVIITHEMSVIEEICDRVAIIDNSRIAEIGSVEDIFMRPKTEIARRLLYASGRLGEEMMSERCLRIIFDGTQASSPVIGNMVLECGAPVNILFADTKTIEGKMVGYTLVQLPENEAVVSKMKKYLEMHQVHYLEEAYHV